MRHFKLPPLKAQSSKGNKEIPWGVKHINAEGVWNTSKGEDVVVAVLDTGIDTSHSDLKDRVIDGWNFTRDYNRDGRNYQDNQGHGTHVAGTIAGVQDANGVVGVAPNVKLLACKVLSGEGYGSYGDIVAGIDWATKWRGPNGERVRVISMSLGGPYDIPSMYDAIKRAIEAGIAVVCASGNDGDGSADTHENMYPGAYQEVIEVGAIGKKNKVAHFSNTNNYIDLVAPGVDIVSSVPNNQYAKMSGTSMAAPHVSGAIALLIAAYETQEKYRLTEPEVYELLMKHVRKSKLPRESVGEGILDLKLFDDIYNPKKEKPLAKVAMHDQSYFVEVGPYETEQEAVQAKQRILSNVSLESEDEN